MPGRRWRGSGQYRLRLGRARIDGRGENLWLEQLHRLGDAVRPAGDPVNAVAPDARAHCQIRYTVDTDPTGFETALRRHLDANGFATVRIESGGVRMPASRTNPGHPWVRWTLNSMERTLGKRVQVIPNSSGGLPGDVFVDYLGVPLVWVPHSYNGCKQHGPDEHLLRGPAREGLAAYAGIWWDLGEPGTP